MSSHGIGEAKTVSFGRIRGREGSLSSPSSNLFVELQQSSSSTAQVNHREEERTARTRDIKERLGPIVTRLKSSLNKIQQIEDSLNCSNKYKVNADNSKEGTSLTSTTSNCPGRSRDLMHQSMEIVKNKLLLLKSLEDDLSASENRRENLQHQLLHITFSKRSSQLSVADTEKSELEKRVLELEREVAILEKKCLTLNDLQTRNIELVVKTKRYDGLKWELKQADEERASLKEDLCQRQAKIIEQAIKIDDMEVKIEHLQSLCGKLNADLKKYEDKNAMLEQQLLEKRKLVLQDTSLVRSECCAFQSHCSRASTTATAEDESSFDSDSASSCGCCSSDHNRKNGTLHYNVEVSDNKMDEKGKILVPTLLQRHLPDTPGSAEARMLRFLIEKVEILDKENAELRQSNCHAMVQINALQNEIKHQASAIQIVRQKTTEENNQSNKGGGEDIKGYFLSRFRKNNYQSVA